MKWGIPVKVKTHIDIHTPFPDFIYIHAHMSYPNMARCPKNPSKQGDKQITHRELCFILLENIVASLNQWLMPHFKKF